MRSLKKLGVLTAFVVLALLSDPTDARAQYQPSCAPPEHPGIEAERDQDFWAGCDMYTRRLQYAAEQQDFREALDRRRDNFYAPRQAERESYYLRLESMRR